MEIRALAEYIVKALVDYPEQVVVVIVASRWGKIKTLVQMIGGSILLFMIPTGDYSR